MKRRNIFRLIAAAFMFILMASATLASSHGHSMNLNTFMQNDDSVNIMKKYFSGSGYKLASSFKPGVREVGTSQADMKKVNVPYSEEFYTKVSAGYRYEATIKYSKFDLLFLEINIIPDYSNNDARMGTMMELLINDFTKFQRVFGNGEDRKILEVLEYTKQVGGNAGDRTNNIEITTNAGREGVMLRVKGIN